jgi:hypothetical protein
MSRLPALLACCLFVLPGCYYSAGYYAYDNYSVSVTASAEPATTFTGMAVDLNSSYAIDNAAVYITTQDWTVTAAPTAATYALTDGGRDATLLAVTPGTYVVRYRTWYYTNYDYDYCYCTTATGYRESFVTITVVPAPSA